MWYKSGRDHASCTQESNTAQQTLAATPGKPMNAETCPSATHYHHIMTLPSGTVYI